MPTVMDLLAAHAAICAECLTEHTQWRSDVVFHELLRLGIVPQEGPCATCDTVTPVYSVG